MYCLQRQSIPDRSIPTDVQRLWLYTTMKMLLILPTTVLEQTMNNMKQCIMKSTLNCYYNIMKSVVTLLDTSFCQPEMHDCKKIAIMGSHLTSRSIHPQSQPVCSLKAGSKARINVNSDS